MHGELDQIPQQLERVRAIIWRRDSGIWVSRSFILADSLIGGLIYAGSGGETR